MHYLRSSFVSAVLLTCHLVTGAPTAAIPTELRILPLGDSITWGYASPDGNGYRLKLLDDLTADGDKIVFAGTVQGGNMTDNWNAGYPAKTIQYIGSQAPSSLAQNPNIVLLMAGTNDMNSNPYISTEGDDPAAAAGRLNTLVGQIFDAVPNTVVLLGKIPNIADDDQEVRTKQFNDLVPQIVYDRASSGQHIQLADMSVIQANQTIDGIHPDEAHYQLMGDIWYQGIKGLPSAWIQKPVGPDPVRS
ncbi:carbohydrate esterase family 3 protein [Zasmidium cellare ATCC 36951]|uniref:Carbohydrate esterase family 3 protein n=1 Tax=Zasmidium cellare ATCC 36951 TaxID=1080233 RepID=A0A6A6BYH3_ZASCE|nr:carbohydrate esterase family 3 protein [Zasmidium cellare ATCC 36951]KAF2158456.1 carbohydrate esterase family 3 protein [Zasmidium cellare ATCC 36951]